MIFYFLKKYYDTHGINPKYTKLRSFVLNNHEVAWMRLNGTVEQDIMGEGREGEPWVSHELYCECDFREGVGWEIRNDELFNLDNPRECLYKKTICHLRHLELRDEYLKRFLEEKADKYFFHQVIADVILDLIEKVKANEFIGEDGNGASFWGGYFYLQTVAEITDMQMEHLWKDLEKLVAEKKISLEGAIIQPYTEPPPLAWEEYFMIEGDDGWTGIASLPGHRKMASYWKLEVRKPNGDIAYSSVLDLRLIHDPVFGPDAEDVAQAEARLLELIKKNKNPDQSD